MTTIDFRKEGTPYTPYWKNCVGAGRANEGLRAGFQKHLKQVQEQIGFRYLRFHGLLHDDMFVLRENENGEKVYNFQYIDELFDTLLELNIRPFVELGFFPACLKGGNATQFWWKANVTPPNNLDGWCELIDRLIGCADMGRRRCGHGILKYGTSLTYMAFGMAASPNISLCTRQPLKSSRPLILSFGWAARLPVISCRTIDLPGKKKISASKSPTRWMI